MSRRPSRCAVLVLLGFILGLTPTLRGQESVYVVVPQARTTVVSPERAWHTGHTGQPGHPGDRRPGRPAPVTLKAVESHVSISDQIATTTLVLTLKNSSSGMLEAQILLPVPEGAAIRSFQLDSLGTEPTAKLLPRDEARQIYDAIVRQMKDPGLLEFAGYNQIRTSVFPIPANGEETARITYEHVLQVNGGRIDYVLPRSSVAADSRQGETAWAITVDLRASRPISTVYSSSHDITTERHSPRHLTVKADARALAQPGAFQVSYLPEPSDKDGIAATMMAYPDADVADGKGGYLMLLAALPEAKNGRASIKREVTIVIDRSGSMLGEKMDQAREAARQVLEALDEGEAFNIIDFASNVQMFSPVPVIKNAESMGEARGYLAAVRASGGTNIHGALLAALRQKTIEGMLPVVLFLTDGQATVGPTGETQIRRAAIEENRHERRIFTFGLGYDVNAPLLSALAQEARAVSTFVLPEEDVEVKVGQVFRRLAGPVLASPKLTILDANDKPSTRLIRDIHPPVLPDVFEGDQIMILGQYTEASQVRFRLEGNYLGEQRVFEIAIDTREASPQHSYVPRLWAGRKIAALIDEIRQAGATHTTRVAHDPRMKELVDEIVRLSLKYGILTEYTAFLATEPGADVPGTSATSFREAPARTQALLLDAAQTRSGRQSVEQQQRLDEQSRVTHAGQFYNLESEARPGARRGRAAGVQHIGDRTLFMRQGRWVDANLFREEEAEPQVVIEFGSPEYSKLLERLVRENLQGLLANPEETYLLLDGQRVLVRGPS